MFDTPASLLQRLWQPADQEAWEQFVELYTPLLNCWASRMGLESNDAADLVQEVFSVLIQVLPTFRYERMGSFRGWLRTVALNKLRDRLKRRSPVVTGTMLIDWADPAPAVDEIFSQSEYTQQIVGRALRLMRTEFQPATWQAFWQLMVDEHPPEKVADNLGISVNSVYLAKSRVLRRLRERLAGLLD